MSPLPPVSAATAAWIDWLWYAVRWLLGLLAGGVSAWSSLHAAQPTAAPAVPWWLSIAATVATVYVLGAGSVLSPPAGESASQRRPET